MSILIKIIAIFLFGLEKPGKLYQRRKPHGEVVERTISGVMRSRSLLRVFSCVIDSNFFTALNVWNGVSHRVGKSITKWGSHAKAQCNLRSVIQIWVFLNFFFSCFSLCFCLPLFSHISLSFMSIEKYFYELEFPH